MEATGTREAEAAIKSQLPLRPETAEASTAVPDSHLTGFNLAGASVSGWFSGDDYATLKVIHRVGGADTVTATIQATAYYCPAFPGVTVAFCGLMPFTISSSSLSADGNNVLRLEVTNAGSNPTGAYFEVDPTPLPAGSLSLFPSVPSLSLAAGGPSSPVTVTLTPGGGFRGAANITVPGLPSGVSVVTPSPIPAVYVGPAPVQIVLNVQASASASSVSGAQFTIGAPPASPAAVTVTVSGTSATPPTITTSTLPNGWLNTGYTQTTFQATGGSGGYTWAVISGTLQSGLSISSAGVLNGTPTVSGTNSFTVRVTDTAAGTTTAAYAITVWPGPPAYSISASPLSQTVTVGSQAQLRSRSIPLTGLREAFSLPSAVLARGATRLTLPLRNPR